MPAALMAGVPHSLGEERATVPRIVLPITSRGLELTDRLCWFALGAAMAAAAALILYLTRGTTFFPDEIDWVYATPNLSAGDVLEPHNGHLIATTRLVYKAILETVGVEYIVFRVLAVLALLLSAGLFYALARRRIGALPALAPTLVLLFLGSAPVHVTSPVGFSPVFSIAAGLAALLALERGDRRGDLAACALITLSLATYSTGLAFLVGVAISVLLRPGRLRRAWIFLVPLVLYAAWWLWALTSESSVSGEASPFNILLIPNWVADSLAVVLAALTGLGYEFADPAAPGVSLGWGRMLAALAVVALVLRIRRGDNPPSLWVSLGIVLAYWSLGGLVAGSFARTPEAARFIYPGAVGVLLVATAAGGRIRFSRLGLAVLFTAVAFSLATNLALLRDGAAQSREDRSPPTRAYFAVLELARGHVDPNFAVMPPEVSPVASPAATYFAVADRYGSLAFSLSDLERKPESVRQSADHYLASALALRLEASSRPDAGCRRLRTGQPGAPVGFELPRGGASMRVRAVGPAAVSLGRFATLPSVEAGELS
ncbi:MAG: hypothetical protein ACRDL1_08385, partial [Solirubrobacterales bacterium]